MTAYYNEIEPFAADWLRNLISAGLIAPGEVDTRSIKDVSADDVRGFTQCHFFAGIGGWPAALRLARWPDDCPVWTGSCPCQPFSAAGQRKGTADERHLWPEFRRLIAECSPSVVFGEQVASKDGRKWLAGVCVDLEALGYGVGAADLCAAGKSAPHIRQRLWCVADADGLELCGQPRAWKQPEHEQDGRTVRLADNSEDRRREGHKNIRGSNSGVRAEGNGIGPSNGGQSRILGDADGARRNARSQERQERGEAGLAMPSAGSEVRWSDFAVIPCLDGKSRRIESGSFPLAARIPISMGRGRSKLERVAIRAARANRTGRLKGYGNAIVPELAAEFIAAFMESVE